MKPNTAYLFTLLSNNDVTFFIPPYQRNYEWTDDQCEVFLDDIFKTYEKNKAGEKTEHFIGTVTYFQTESVFGQPLMPSSSSSEDSVLNWMDWKTASDA